MPAALPRQIDLFADLDGFDIEPGTGRFQNMQRRLHDLGPDAVTVGDCNRYIRHIFMLLSWCNKMLDDQIVDFSRTAASTQKRAGRENEISIFCRGRYNTWYSSRNEEALVFDESSFCRHWAGFTFGPAGFRADPANGKGPRTARTPYPAPPKNASSKRQRLQRPRSRQKRLR